jgi:aryl sulfotransferase
MPARPERTTQYVTEVVDTRRWDSFVHRPGDIFVCTPPKCGTTWMQTICVMLVQGTSEIDGRVADVSRWLDQTRIPLEDTLAALQSQSRRRVIKTHTPLDGFPYFDDCTYVTVYRDPRDAFFSGRNHRDNFRLPQTRRSIEDPDADFLASMQPPASSLTGLKYVVHHYKTFKAFGHLGNIHMYHYADLSRDLTGNVKRVADALEIQLGDDVLDRIVDAVTFSNMKKNFDRYVPGAGQGIWVDDARFLHKGSHGQWRGVLSEQALAQYDAMMREQLPAEDIAWLQQGCD